MMRLVFTALAITLGLAGCSEQPGAPPSPTSSPSPTPEQALGNECTSPQKGYRVSYPDDWHVNDPEDDNADQLVGQLLGATVWIQPGSHRRIYVAADGLAVNA